jgi:hypothetical protein
MRNGRCRMHGGLSTGPRTAEGLARLRAARTRHGAYSAEALALRRRFAGLLRRARDLLEWSDAPMAVADQATAGGAHDRPAQARAPRLGKATEPSCAGPWCSAACAWVEEELAKDHPMLSFLLVLTTVVAGVVLARIGVEKLLLSKLPSDPFGS